MNFVLMADIIKSSDKESNALIESFRQLVGMINEEYTDIIISPMTITLGDEFQGIVKDLSAGLKLMVAFEEKGIELGLGFKMRYVLGQGKIDTPINKETAYGMIGPGLTETRKYLNAMKKTGKRFEFMIEGEHVESISDLFFLYQFFVDSWHKKDLEVVSTFLKLEDYKSVSSVLKKDPSSMWRRERNLGIREYQTCKKLINAYA